MSPSIARTRQSAKIHRPHMAIGYGYRECSTVCVRDPIAVSTKSPYCLPHTDCPRSLGLFPLLLTYAVIKSLQHGDDLGPAEFRGNLLVLGKHFAQTCARNLQPMFGSVRTGSRRRHSIAFITKECDVDLERLDGEAVGRKRVEDILSVKGAVIAADAGMVASDDEMRTAEVL